MTIQMVTVEEAVRLPPAHDIMEIRRGGVKGSATHRDYVIQEGHAEHFCRLAYVSMCLYERLPVS